MDGFVWSTIILGVWAAIGPLVGVRYGHDLAKRWQKEHWISDNKKQEYRELLGILTASFGAIESSNDGAVDDVSRMVWSFSSKWTPRIP